jgi:23S rRNA (guanine745-N1)-methyltransferase
MDVRAEGARAGDARAGQARGAKVVSAAERRAALGAVSGYLRCPVCAGPVRVDGGQLGCERAHRFDIARQGYVNLVSGRPGAGTADSAEMVAAREEFLGRGHYRPLADAIAGLADAEAGAAGVGAREREPSALVVDLAGGTGYYLAAVLDSLPGRYGACLDLSVSALRRAARAHPRAAAIGADAWRPLPLADGSAGIALSVFGPRNAAEISRVLAPGGTLIIASPGPGHLDELRGPLGMIGIDERKSERITDAYGDYTRAAAVSVNCRLSLGHDDIAALVAMGPSARHITPEALTSRVRALPAPVAVTVDVQVRALQRPLLRPCPAGTHAPVTHAPVTHAIGAAAPRSASAPGCAAGTGSFGSRSSTPRPIR